MIKVYTFKPSFMQFGPGPGSPIATHIDEYERVSIGRGYYGIVFKNTHTGKWHMALEGCGALIGTEKTKKGLVASVIKDVATGDPELMKKQMKEGQKDCESAEVLQPSEFFKEFR